jgi:quinol monooxygenase YgiN
MSIIVRAEAVTSAVNVAAFQDVAKRLAAAAAAEPGTVQYRWFSTEDPLRFVVIEEYTDEAAAFAHNQGCADLLQRVNEVAELATVQIHGPIGPDLASWVSQQPQASAYHPLAG